MSFVAQSKSDSFESDAGISVVSSAGASSVSNLMNFFQTPPSRSINKETPFDEEGPAVNSLTDRITKMDTRPLAVRGGGNSGGCISPKQQRDKVGSLPQSISFDDEAQSIGSVPSSVLLKGAGGEMVVLHRRPAEYSDNMKAVQSKHKDEKLTWKAQSVEVQRLKRELERLLEDQAVQRKQLQQSRTAVDQKQQQLHGIQHVLQGTTAASKKAFNLQLQVEALVQENRLLRQDQDSLKLTSQKSAYSSKQTQAILNCLETNNRLQRTMLDNDASEKEVSAERLIKGAEKQLQACKNDLIGSLPEAEHEAMESIMTTMNENFQKEVEWIVGKEQELRDFLTADQAHSQTLLNLTDQMETAKSLYQAHIDTTSRHMSDARQKLQNLQLEMLSAQTKASEVCEILRDEAAQERAKAADATIANEVLIREVERSKVLAGSETKSFEAQLAAVNMTTHGVIADLRAALSDSEKRNHTLEGKKQDLLAEKVEFTRTRVEDEDMIFLLRIELKETKEAASSAQSNASTLKDELSKLDGRVSKLQEESDALRDRDKNRAELSSLEASKLELLLEEHQVQILQLEQDHDEHVDANKKAHEDEQNEIASLHQNVSDLQSEITTREESSSRQMLATKEELQSSATLISSLQFTIRATKNEEEQTKRGNAEFEKVSETTIKGHATKIERLQTALSVVQENMTLIQQGYDDVSIILEEEKKTHKMKAVELESLLDQSCAREQELREKSGEQESSFAKEKAELIVTLAESSEEARVLQLRVLSLQDQETDREKRFADLRNDTIQLEVALQSLKYQSEIELVEKDAEIEQLRLHAKDLKGAQLEITKQMTEANAEVSRLEQSRRDLQSEMSSLHEQFFFVATPGESQTVLSQGVEFEDVLSSLAKYRALLTRTKELEVLNDTLEQENQALSLRVGGERAESATTSLVAQGPQDDLNRCIISVDSPEGKIKRTFGTLKVENEKLKAEKSRFMFLEEKLISRNQNQMHSIESLEERYHEMKNSTVEREQKLQDELASRRISLDSLFEDLMVCRNEVERLRTEKDKLESSSFTEKIRPSETSRRRQKLMDSLHLIDSQKLTKVVNTVNEEGGDVSTSSAAHPKIPRATKRPSEQGEYLQSVLEKQKEVKHEVGWLMGGLFSKAARRISPTARTNDIGTKVIGAKVEELEEENSRLRSNLVKIRTKFKDDAYTSRKLVEELRFENEAMLLKNAALADRFTEVQFGPIICDRLLAVVGKDEPQ